MAGNESPALQPASRHEGSRHGRIPEAPRTAVSTDEVLLEVGQTFVFAANQKDGGDDPTWLRDVLLHRHVVRVGLDPHGPPRTDAGRRRIRTSFVFRGTWVLRTTRVRSCASGTAMWIDVCLHDCVGAATLQRLGTNQVPRDNPPRHRGRADSARLKRLRKQQVSGAEGVMLRRLRSLRSEAEAMSK